MTPWARPGRGRMLIDWVASTLSPTSNCASGDSSIGDGAIVEVITQPSPYSWVRTMYHEYPSPSLGPAITCAQIPVGTVAINRADVDGLRRMLALPPGSPGVDYPFGLTLRFSGT